MVSLCLPLGLIFCHLVMAFIWFLFSGRGIFSIKHGLAFKVMKIITKSDFGGGGSRYLAGFTNFNTQKIIDKGYPWIIFIIIHTILCLQCIELPRYIVKQ